MITPALEPWDWGNIRPWDAGKMIGGNRALIDASQAWDDAPEMRHGIAAYALHGQPFGFTWADVDELRSEARFDSLADRIEALLPPNAEPPPRRGP